MTELLFPTASSTGLRLGRIVALIIIGAFLLAWLLGAMLWWQGIFRDLDTILSATFFNNWTAAEVRSASAELGVAPVVFPILWFILEIVLLLGFGVMSLLLFVRKPDWFGTYLAVIFMVVATSITGPVIMRVDTLLPGFRAFYQTVLEVGSVFGLVTLLFLFPTGHFVPGWLKWLAPAAFVLYIAYEAAQFSRGAEPRADTAFRELAPLIIMVAAGLGSQLYRYLFHSGPIERRQTRGVIFSFTLFVVVVGLSAMLFPNAVLQSEPPAPIDLVGFFIQLSAASVAILGVIVAITLGVLRYRLWDLDVLIRRTTSYAVITVLLAMVYFGSVVVLQRVFTALTGQTSTVAIVLSTLLIAALFLPVQQRVQDAINRRFNRRKYDAQKTLEQFAETVRDETDLDALTAELVRVIEETMQPEFVNIWLTPSEGVTSPAGTPAEALPARSAD